MYGDTLTTKELVKGRLQITATTFDTVLDRLILAVTARIEQMTGRRFTQATFTNELHDGSDTYGKRRAVLVVKNAPIATVTSIEYKSGLNASPTWTAYTANDYDVDLPSGLVYLKGALPPGIQNIRITYAGGWAANDMPVDIKEVCEVAVTRLFKRRDSEGRVSESFGESSITWEKNVFTLEDLVTIKNYRRGYNL